MKQNKLRAGLVWESLCYEAQKDAWAACQPYVPPDWTPIVPCARIMRRYLTLYPNTKLAAFYLQKMREQKIPLAQAPKTGLVNPERRDLQDLRELVRAIEILQETGGDIGVYMTMLIELGSTPGELSTPAIRALRDLGWVQKKGKRIPI